jgi:hypothetical protein
MIALKSLYIWNFRLFSLSIHLNSCALPLNIERYPGSNSRWTYRIRLLCFNLYLYSRETLTQCDYCNTPFYGEDLIAEEGDMWSCQACWDRNEEIDNLRRLESSMG